MKRYNVLELFSGCGGLADGFQQAGEFNHIAAVDHDPEACETLRYRLQSRWDYKNAEDTVLCFDIARCDELINGWENDPVYQSGKGIDTICEEAAAKIEVFVGGPPSHFLFNSGKNKKSQDTLMDAYIKLLKHYKPKAFVFEYAAGLLSEKFGDGSTNAADIFVKRLDDAGYLVPADLSKAIIDFSHYGVAQKKERLIILGLSKAVYGKRTAAMLDSFYSVLLPRKCEIKHVTVRDAIGDLPALMPYEKAMRDGDRIVSHMTHTNQRIRNHEPRFINNQSKKAYQTLANAAQRGKEPSFEELVKIYSEITNKKRKTHKFRLLKWDEPCADIPASLYKDGYRFVHPDAKQARTLTVREIARLQGFPDDFEFYADAPGNYAMVCSAVPPVFSEKMAETLYQFLFINERF